MTQDDEKLGSAENVRHRSYAEDMDDTVHVTQLLSEAKPKLWTKRMFRLYGTSCSDISALSCKDTMAP